MSLDNFNTQLHTKVDIKLSSFGFATFCDFYFCNRVQGTFPLPFQLDNTSLNKIKYADKLFLNFLDNQKNYYLPQLLHYLKSKNLKVFFFILYEPSLDFNEYINLLPYALHILTTNNWIDSPIVHNLPMGIRDGEEVFSAHKGFSQKTLLQFMKFNTLQNRINKNILCLLCFTTYTWCAEDRNLCYNILNNKSFITNLNSQTFEESNANSCCGKVPLEYNYQKTLESHFILSPTGLGQATHRFFEAIMLGSIPIVKKTNTPFDKLYNFFPCLIINDWYEITEPFLKSNINQCYQKLDEFNHKYPNYYNDIDLLFDITIQHL